MKKVEKFDIRRATIKKNTPARQGWVVIQKRNRYLIEHVTVIAEFIVGGKHDGEEYFSSPTATREESVEIAKCLHGIDLNWAIGELKKAKRRVDRLKAIIIK